MLISVRTLKNVETNYSDAHSFGNSLLEKKWGKKVMLSHQTDSRKYVARLVLFFGLGERSEAESVWLARAQERNSRRTKETEHCEIAFGSFL